MATSTIKMPVSVLSLDLTNTGNNSGNAKGLNDTFQLPDLTGTKCIILCARRFGYVASVVLRTAVIQAGLTEHVYVKYGNTDDALQMVSVSSTGLCTVTYEGGFQLYYDCIVIR